MMMSRGSGCCFFLSLLMQLLWLWVQLLPAAGIRNSKITTRTRTTTTIRATTTTTSIDEIASDYDVVVIGAGIGGLSAAAILSSVYNLKVGVFEAHYRLGGCAHSFPHRSSKSGCNYLFDAGPTILLGCSSKPYNPLRQVLLKTLSAMLMKCLTPSHLCY